jgi:hypothetical protein
MQTENQWPPAGLEIVKRETVDLDATGTNLHWPTLPEIA